MTSVSQSPAILVEMSRVLIAFSSDDERKLRVFMDKRMGNEVAGDSVGDEWKGYVWTSLFSPY